MPYSVHPWRLLDAQGREVCAPCAFDHPDLGKTLISQPISGATKTECTERTLALLQALADGRITWRPHAN